MACDANKEKTDIVQHMTYHPGFHDSKGLIRDIFLGFSGAGKFLYKIPGHNPLYPQHQYTNSPHCSLYISYRIHRDNFFFKKKELLE